MALLESALISAVLPAGIDMVKNLFGGVSRKFFGLSVDDQIKVDQAQVEKMKALAALDNPGGTPSQWVIDLRASFRYIGAGICILSGIGLMVYSPTNIELAAQLIAMPFSFIFGERMYLAVTGKQK